MSKKNFKLLAALAMFGASVLWAQEFEFSFTNELSSDIVTIDNGETNFAGITENASIEFSSEKVDAYLEVEFTLGTGTGNDVSKTNHLNFAWTDLDYWLHFRPFKILTLAFHDDLWMDGSYLPLWDDNAPAGGLGSSGFTLMVEPIEGLRIAATIPMDNLDDGLANFLNGDEDEGEHKPFDLGFGAEYAFGELFSVGAKVGDLIDSDEIYFGVFAAIRPLKSDDLIIRAGYGHYEGENGILEELDYSENIALAGKNIFNASVEWAMNDFALAAEIVCDTDFDDEYEDEDSDKNKAYDMYIGVKFGYAITENFMVGLGGQCFLDFGEANAKPVFGVEPSVGCAFGNHEFSLAADLEFCDGDIFVKFPISWTYSF